MEKNGYLPGLSKPLSMIIAIAFFTGIAAMVAIGLMHVSPVPLGDENFYVQSVQNVSNHSIIQELAAGNPVGYTFLVYLLSKTGIGILTAARVLTLLATIAVFVGLWQIGRRHFKLYPPYLLLAVMSCFTGLLTSGNYIYVAADDMYFTAFFIWLGILIWQSANTWGNWKRPLLAGGLLAALLIVRPLAVVYFFAAIGAFVMMALTTKNEVPKKILTVGSFIVGFGLIFLLVQTPALLQSGHFIDENKKADTIHTQANWVQKLDLSNLKKEKGENLDDGTAASWKQCDEYLTKYGNNALPKKEIQRLTWRPGYVFRYYTIGALKTGFVFVRHTGLVFILALLFVYRAKQTRYRMPAFFTLLCIVFFAIYLLHFLNFIETRHFLVPIIFLVLSGTYIIQTMEQEDSKRAAVFALAQLAALVIILILDLSFYFSSHADWIYYG